MWSLLLPLTDAECEVPTFPGCGAAEASITVDVIGQHNNTLLPHYKGVVVI